MAFAADAPRLSGIFLKKGKRFRLSLSESSISWTEENDPEKCTIISLNQLIAAHPCDCSSHKPLSRCHHCALGHHHMSPSWSDIIPRNSKSLKLHYAVPHRKSLWKLENQTLSPVESATLKIWLSNLEKSLQELNRPKQLLVFINPYGGKKKGAHIYARKVLPLLHLAGINAQVILTQRPNHARDVVQDIDIHRYDGVICVGGDGIFSEVLNGILLKTQREKSVDLNDIYADVKSPRIPFGLIPCGSTNAAANCVMGTEDPVSATLLIIIGNTVGVDLCSIYNEGNFLKFVATFLSYGYFGDMLLDSEKVKFLGPKRYEFSGFKKIMGRQLYKGELQLKVSSALERSSWENERCQSSCSICGKAKERSQHGDTVAQSPAEKFKWITLQSKFMSISSAIMSCACGRSKSGISPSQHIGNGYCDVIIVSAKSRIDYLRYLLRTAYNYKNPFDLDYVQVYRVKEFMFSPYVTEDRTPEVSCTGNQQSWQPLKTSVWNCDGEVIQEPSLYSKVHCQLLNVFGNGIEKRNAERPSSECFGFCRKTQTTI